MVILCRELNFRWFALCVNAKELFKIDRNENIEAYTREF
jgi:hypothetical protein